jgi:hypothetical protein
MKKLTFILLILISFTYGEIIAQSGANSDIPLDYGGNATIFRNAGGADRPSTSGVFGTQGQWSTDLTISEYTPSNAAATWTGPSHIGMGATGWGSFTAGAYNRASGNGAFVGGFHNVAGPTDSDITVINGGSIGQTAFGYGTQATGNASFSAGEGTEASGSHAVVFGKNSVASGSYSTAIGFETDATDYGSLVIGQYNSSGSSATSAGSFSTSAPAFVIGNGASGSLSDAFKVIFNGDTTMAGDLTVTGNDVTFGNGETISNAIDDTLALTASTTTVSGDLQVTGNDLQFGNGESISNASDDTVTITSATVALTANVTIGNDLTVSGDVVVSSDARLKSNIVSLGSTLSRLLLIDGKSYEMKGKQKIGVLAQEIKEVFPELVSKDDNEMLAVNYQGLVPVLINALKEQDDKISRLENLVEKLISDK